MDGEDRLHETAGPVAGQGGERNTGDAARLRQRFVEPLGQGPPHGGRLPDQIPFIGRNHQRAAFLHHFCRDGEVLIHQGLAAVEHEHGRFREAKRPSRGLCGNRFRT